MIKPLSLSMLIHFCWTVDLLSVISITVSIVATLAILMNLFLAHAANVSAKLNTRGLPAGTLFNYPCNTLGPERFGEGAIASDFLDLVIFNSGPGVSKSVWWEIKGPEGKENGSLPSLGKDSEVIVRGYIQKYHITDDIQRNFYSVTICYRAVFGIRRRCISLQFDGSGTLKSFAWKLQGRNNG